MTPHQLRIQRKRTKGWKMPEDAVYMGRPSPWGNPFNWEDINPKVADTLRKRMARLRFREWIQHPDQSELLARAKKELKGKKGACWCKLTDPCHVDVWLQLIND